MKKYVSHRQAAAQQKGAHLEERAEQPAWQTVALPRQRGEGGLQQEGAKDGGRRQRRRRRRRRGLRRSTCLLIRAVLAGGKGENQSSRGMFTLPLGLIVDCLRYVCSLPSKKINTSCSFFGII